MRPTPTGHEVWHAVAPWRQSDCWCGMNFSMDFAFVRSLPVPPGIRHQIKRRRICRQCPWCQQVLVPLVPWRLRKVGMARCSVNCVRGRPSMSDLPLKYRRGCSLAAMATCLLMYTPGHMKPDAARRTCTFTPAHIHVSLPCTRTHAHARARRRLQFIVRDAMCRPLVAEVDIHS